MIILPDDMTRGGTWDFAGTIWAAPIAQTDIFTYNIYCWVDGRGLVLWWNSQFVYHIVAMDDILPPQQGETSWAETPLGLTWPRGKKINLQ